MLNQIFVMSPSGPCFVHRTYEKDGSTIDPQLITAIMTAEKFRGNSFSTLKKILQEGREDQNINIHIQVEALYNYVTAAISSGNPDKTKVANVLRKLGQMSYETLGSSKKLYSIETSKIERMEMKVDILLASEGFITC